MKESSFDTWIKFYRPDENSSNTRISYYAKGAVVAFLLDAKIRKLTDGEKSLDDVMRKMYESFSKSGFTSKDFRKTASEIAGEDLSDWFTSTIDSTDELVYDDLESIGIVVPNKKKADTATDESSENKSDEAEKDDAKPRKKSPRKRMKKSPAKPAKPTPWLGVSTGDTDGKITVSSVKPNSPASDVGLNIKDEIIAINGFRVRSVDSSLAQYEVGDEIEVLIARRGELMTMKMTIAKRERESWALKLIAKPTEKQQEQIDLWLGAEEKE